MVNGTVGFGNDALPVKAFNTALAKTTRLASAMALKPMTARIGLTLVIEIEAETDFEKVPLSIFPAPKSFLVIKIDLSKNPSGIHAAGRLQSESRGFVTFIYSDASAPAPGLGSRGKRSKSESKCSRERIGRISREDLQSPYPDEGIILQVNITTQALLLVAIFVLKAIGRVPKAERLERSILAFGSTAQS